MIYRTVVGKGTNVLWIWSVLLVLLLLIGWASNLIGLPGNWFNVAAAAVYAWLMPSNRWDFGWAVVALLVGLAVLGEVLEFLAGAAGVARVGGTKRGAALALVGSLVGGVVGIFVGLPVPLIGSVLAALLFSGVGALIGAMIGETWAGRDWQKSLDAGHGAFWGRLLGTLGKILVGSVIVVVAAVAMIV